MEVFHIFIEYLCALGYFYWGGGGGGGGGNARVCSFYFREILSISKIGLQRFFGYSETKRFSSILEARKVNRVFEIN